MLDFLSEVFVSIIGELFGGFFRFIGAMIYSLISFFKTSPLEYFRTTDSDEQIMQFWTGFFFTACIIFSLYWVYYH